jgi:hypothetical protein
MSSESPDGSGGQNILQTVAAWVCLCVSFFVGLRMSCRILLMVCFCIRPCTNVSCKSVARSYLSPVDGGDGDKNFFHLYSFIS